MTIVRLKTRTKYGAEKTDGSDSGREARRARELRLLERAGEISNLRIQVPYLLIEKQDGERAVYYTADFVYLENGQEVVEDAKGVRTRDYIIRRKLMLLVHGIKVRET